MISSIVEWLALGIAWGLGFWTGWKTGRRQLRIHQRIRR